MHSIAALIDQYHERARSDSPRYHMGASLIGHKCDRWLWLSFRWAIRSQFPGRVLRIFRRGQHEESWIVSDLRDIGIDIRETNDRQSFVQMGPHVGGSPDGVIYSGIPEAPKKKHIAEFKTHNKRSFEEVVKLGVKESKPLHYAQMQAYMRAKLIDRALYFAVCKDDDRIYTERVNLDEIEADRLTSRAVRIALTERIPEPYKTDPTWYECKMCAAHGFCFESEPPHSANCRTCCHSTPTESGEWHCDHWDSVIPNDHQLTGCNFHVLHPDLSPWPFEIIDGGIIFTINGARVENSERGYKTREILANPAVCANPDKFVSDWRAKGAEIIG